MSDATKRNETHIMTETRETPLHVLGRTNLGKYLAERAKLAEKTRLDIPENFRGRGAVIIGDDDTFGEACAMMRALRVRSVPLVRYETPRMRGESSYEALCFLSVGDLAASLLDKLDKLDVDTRETDVVSLMGRMATIGLELESLPLRHARTKWDGTVIWKSATAYHSLSDALQRCLYISPETKPGDVALRAAPHRFAVMNDDKVIEHVVSQSDVCMYLHTNRDVLTPAWTEATVAELGLASTPAVASVGASAPTIECFREMGRHRVGALPVVDEATGALVGTIAESDITHLRGAEFAALALPVGEFLAHAHRLAVWTPSVERREGVFNPNSSAFAVALMQHADQLVVSCKPTDTITQVLEKMDLNAVHRVWIVDDAGRPTGVISLADVLAVVSRIGMDAEEFEKSRAKMMVA